MLGNQNASISMLFRLGRFQIITRGQHTSTFCSTLNNLKKKKIIKNLSENITQHAFRLGRFNNITNEQLTTKAAPA